MKKSLTLVALVALLLVMAAPVLAAPGFSVRPWVYDPDGTGVADAKWVTQVGLPDAGKSNHALFLAKNGPTATNAAGGATVEGVDGITLTELGFDYRNDGYCGAGAPRFNVYTADGVTHFFGCIYGTHTPLNADWTRVRFSPADAFPPVLPGEVVTGIDIVFDEGPGSVYLDNIDVNGVLMGKPGSFK